MPCPSSKAQCSVSELEICSNIIIVTHKMIVLFSFIFLSGSLYRVSQKNGDKMFCGNLLPFMLTMWIVFLLESCHHFFGTPCINANLKYFKLTKKCLGFVVVSHGEIIKSYKEWMCDYCAMGNYAFFYDSQFSKPFKRCCPNQRCESVTLFWKTLYYT